VNPQQFFPWNKAKPWVAAVVLFVLSIVLLVASQESDGARWTFGAVSIALLVAKEVFSAFARDDTIGATAKATTVVPATGDIEEVPARTAREVAVKRLEDWAAISSVFAAVFGLPAVVASLPDFPMVLGFVWPF